MYSNWKGNGWRMVQASSEVQWFLVEDVRELHVVIRDTKAPAGNITQPMHPVALLCVCMCVCDCVKHTHHCAYNQTEAAFVSVRVC